MNSTDARKNFYRIAAIAAFCLSASATPPTNLRELCRQRVAGYYLSIFDRTERSKQLLTLTAQRRKEIDSALAKEKKKSSEQRVALAQAPFDQDLMNHSEQSQSTIRQLESAQQDQMALQSSAEAQIKVDSAELANLKFKIEKVFKFEKVEETAGYNFRLSYHSPCPKFRQSCPLEAQYREPLLKIFADYTAPIECQRYTGIITEKSKD